MKMVRRRGLAIPGSGALHLVYLAAMLPGRIQVRLLPGESRSYGGRSPHLRLGPMYSSRRGQPAVAAAVVRRAPTGGW